MKGLNSQEQKQYIEVWSALCDKSDLEWDDVYEWVEQDYMDKYGVNLNVATHLWVNVRAIYFGRVK